MSSDLGMEDDRKGDAYMNAFQPVLATCPWVRLPAVHQLCAVRETLVAVLRAVSLLVRG